MGSNLTTGKKTLQMFIIKKSKKTLESIHLCQNRAVKKKKLKKRVFSSSKFKQQTKMSKNK